MGCSGDWWAWRWERRGSSRIASSCVHVCGGPRPVNGSARSWTSRLAPRRRYAAFWHRWWTSKPLGGSSAGTDGMVGWRVGAGGGSTRAGAPTADHAGHAASHCHGGPGATGASQRWLVTLGQPSPFLWLTASLTGRSAGCRCVHWSCRRTRLRSVPSYVPPSPLGNETGIVQGLRL